MDTACRLESDIAIEFMEGLKNPEGTDFAGQPLRLTEWEKDFVRKLLDTKRPDGGFQYEESLIFLPKKQGKTTFIAALGLYFMTHRKHGQIKCLAQVKDQAALCYKFIASMIRQDDFLSDRSVCRVYKGRKGIECYESGTTLDVLSSDAIGANGLNGSVVIYDEVCFSKTSDLYDAVKSGGIMRKDFLVIGLSTAGESTADWGFEYYEKAKAIAADPTSDPTFLPLIFEAPAGANWQEVQTYLDCSPTFREMEMKDAIRRITSMIDSAKKRPSELRRILRYHLNHWVGGDARLPPWISVDHWDKCKGDEDPESLAGRVCYGGIDLSGVRDTTAKALFFPPIDPGGRYSMLLKFYMPADTLAEKERKEGGAQYTAWARAGLIVPTPGNWTDYAYIREDLKRDRQKYQLQGVAVDRWNASHMVQELVGDGVDAAMIGQGAITICPAARELDDLVAKEKLQHFGNPMLRWQMQNCVAKMIDDAGNVKPSKRKSTGRIDGIYAMLNAVALEISKRTEGSGDIAVYFG